MSRLLERHLVGKTVVSFVLREHGFCGVEIEGGYSLCTQSPCRFVGADGAFVSSMDHGHRFGLAEPYDAEVAIAKQIVGKAIAGLSMRENTNDLTIVCSSGLLEVVCTSLGYENFQVYGPENLIIAVRCGE